MIDMQQYICIAVEECCEKVQPYSEVTKKTFFCPRFYVLLDFLIPGGIFGDLKARFIRFITHIHLLSNLILLVCFIIPPRFESHSMNLFRLTGDLLHLASFFILLLKMYTTRSVKGLSLKTQALYVVIFLTRYIDLFWNFRSLYNSIMKVIFITLSIAIVYMMKFEKPYNKTYDPSQDFFNPLFLVIPSFVLALFVNEEFTVVEVLWTFSIYLEAVAIIPQLIVIHKCAVETGGFVDTLNSHYVFALGGYRALYFMNWIYRLMTEDKYSNWIVWTAGLVQSAIYCDFFWHYLKARMEGTKMTLPI